MQTLGLAPSLLPALWWDPGVVDIAPPSWLRGLFLCEQRRRRKRRAELNCPSAEALSSEAAPAGTEELRAEGLWGSGGSPQLQRHLLVCWVR